MKFQSLVFCFLVLLLTDYSYAAAKSSISKDSAAAAPVKSADKISYPKKVSTLKKRPSKASLKKVADITDKFKDLPADDLAFIKELDKQFKQHGGKVKIKVENDNATASGNTKNSKRTIEGELGYGYSHNGYDYNPPKYEFYPYSQKDIPSDGPKYYLPNGKTEVSVEPSYSYELKPQTYVSHHHGAEVDLPHPELHAEQQQQQAEQPIEHVPQQEPQQHYEEPVIVLRIPGPAKYASHLQTLLQQYLEIRAAQYLRILEEAEHHKLQQEQPQQHLQEVDYGHASAEEQGGHQLAQGPAEEQYQQHHYQQQHQQQVEYEQQPQYPAIDDVYQHYKQRHPTHPEQAQQPEGQGQLYYVPGHPAAEQQQQHYVPQQHQQHQQQEQPQFYYTHQQEYAQPEGPPANTYQHVFLISMTPQVHSGYEAEQHHHHQQQQQQHQQEEEHQTIYVPEQQEAGVKDHGSDSALPISENNPRPSHTKVLFTHNPEHAGADYTNAYPLPSIKPNERHAPHSVPDYHQDYQQQVHPGNALQQDYQQQVHQQESQESAQHYQQPQATAPAEHQQVVAITQRPFNYHAHGMKPRARGRSPYKRRASNTAVPKGDQDLQKIRDYVRDNLGAQTGTAVEYKTTQVINP